MRRAYVTNDRSICIVPYCTFVCTHVQPCTLTVYMYIALRTAAPLRRAAACTSAHAPSLHLTRAAQLRFLGGSVHETDSRADGQLLLTRELPFRLGRALIIVAIDFPRHGLLVCMPGFGVLIYWVYARVHVHMNMYAWKYWLCLACMPAPLASIMPGFASVTPGIRPYARCHRQSSKLQNFCTCNFSECESPES